MATERSCWGWRNGTTVPCAAHPDELTYETLTADRKVPGSKGGTYRRHNLRPMCLSGNSSRKDNLNWTPATV